MTTNFGNYNDCFKSKCYDEDPVDVKVEYYCQGFGIVRTAVELSPGNVMDLKESGTATVKRAVVIFLTD